MNRSAPFGLFVAAMSTFAPSAEAGTEASEVDVAVRDAPPPHRAIVIEWNPVALVAIGKLSADVIITPASHHALVLSPFYAWATTRPITIFDDSGNATQLPEQKFTGFGGELGYRYYGGERGPRGFFVGPSLLLGSFSARAQDGSKTAYLDYGIAADVGYQMLVGDRVALSLGGGVQYLVTTKAIPDQQFPSWIYANDRVSPRVLASVGWAF